MCLVATPLFAQAAPSDAPDAKPPAAAAGAAAPSPADGNVVAALTPVRIEILATLNSKTSRIGEHFPIRLVTPIALPGGASVPAGIMGSGDVVHAAKSGFGGKPGELILAVRYLDDDGVRIPLRSLAYAPRRGEDRVDTAAGLGIVGGVAGSVVAMFITGGEVNIPAGTIAFAKTSAPLCNDDEFEIRGRLGRHLRHSRHLGLGGCARPRAGRAFRAARGDEPGRLLPAERDGHSDQLQHPRE